jgi:hypothetical protein
MAAIDTLRDKWDGITPRERKLVVLLGVIGLALKPPTRPRLSAAFVAGMPVYGTLIALARKHPGKLNVGSGGNGSAGHLAAEMFKAQARVYMVHIPYAGGSPAQLALIAGQVDQTFDNLAAASANIKGGKLKAVAMTTAKRSGAMPEVPTIGETAILEG